LAYQHLKSYVPGPIWTEVQSYIQNNLAYQENRGEWNVLAEHAITQIRELVSRESYKIKSVTFRDTPRSPQPKHDKSRDFRNPPRKWDRSAPSDPEAALVAEEKRKKRNFERGKNSNHDKKFKLRSFMEAASQALESNSDDDEDAAQDHQVEGLAVRVAKYEEDQVSDSPEALSSAEDDEVEGILRKFDQRDRRSSVRNYEPKKVYPPKKPGYGYIDNVETLIADLEITKKAPCFLDGQNHALVDCPLKSYQRQEIFLRRNICQKCLKTGHVYLDCPYRKNLKCYCESCKKLGHWDFCCFVTLDTRDLAEKKAKQDAEKSKKFSQGKDVIGTILAKIQESTPQIPGGNKKTS
jgi:hypothetical protein